MVSLAKTIKSIFNTVYDSKYYAIYKNQGRLVIEKLYDNVYKLSNGQLVMLLTEEEKNVKEEEALIAYYHRYNNYYKEYLPEETYKILEEQKNIFYNSILEYGKKANLFLSFVLALRGMNYFTDFNIYYFKWYYNIWNSTEENKIIYHNIKKSINKYYDTLNKYIEVETIEINLKLDKLINGYYIAV
jgi:hypothetical protein